MPAALIAQLVIALAPYGIQLTLDIVKELHALWSKPAATPDDTTATLARIQTSYDAYMKAAQQKANNG